VPSSGKKQGGEEGLPEKCKRLRSECNSLSDGFAEGRKVGGGKKKEKRVWIIFCKRGKSRNWPRLKKFGAPERGRRRGNDKGFMNQTSKKGKGRKRDPN